MPQPFTGYILQWLNDYSLLANKFWQVGTGLHLAADAILIEDWANAHGHLENAAQNAWDASRLFRYGTDPLYNVALNALLWINNNIGGGDELTMDKILEIIWDSDKLRWFHFINYIDAMRGGIWNTEIYETHLEEWYRHFSI